MERKTKMCHKLIVRMDALVNVMDTHAHSVVIHRTVDQVFYIQKSAEMKEIERQLEVTRERLEVLQDMMDQSYREIFHSWKRDARWLGRQVVFEQLKRKEKEASQQ